MGHVHFIIGHSMCVVLLVKQPCRIDDTEVFQMGVMLAHQLHDSKHSPERLSKEWKGHSCCSLADELVIALAFDTSMRPPLVLTPG